MKFTKNLLLLVCILQLFLASDVTAQDTAQTKGRKGHFELSFGQSILFISNSDQVNLLTKSAVVVPTSSVLLFAEFRTLSKIKIPIFCNIPVTAKQFIINNQIVNEQASASFGTGLQFKIFEYEVLSKAIMEMEFGPMLSVGSDQKGDLWAAPFLAGRIRVRKGENFVMYIGASYAMGLNTFGLLYGTGTIF